jgi:hypothetical protein
VSVKGRILVTGADGQAGCGRLRQGLDRMRASARENGVAVSVVGPRTSSASTRRSDCGRWTPYAASSVRAPGELYDPDTDATWDALRSHAVSRDQPCAVIDLDGQPAVCRFVDAPDVAHGILCALESRAAVGETFNLSAPVRSLFDLDSTKARKSLLEDAMAFRQQETGGLQ